MDNLPSGYKNELYLNKTDQSQGSETAVSDDQIRENYKDWREFNGTVTGEFYSRKAEAQCFEPFRRTIMHLIKIQNKFKTSVRPYM